jgi:hypothetical protein
LTLLDVIQLITSQQQQQQQQQQSQKGAAGSSRASVSSAGSQNPNVGHNVTTNIDLPGSSTPYLPSQLGGSSSSLSPQITPLQQSQKGTGLSGSGKLTQNLTQNLTQHSEKLNKSALTPHHQPSAVITSNLSSGLNSSQKQQQSAPLHPQQQPSSSESSSQQLPDGSFLLRPRNASSVMPSSASSASSSTSPIFPPTPHFGPQNSQYFNQNNVNTQTTHNTPNNPNTQPSSPQLSPIVHPFWSLINNTHFIPTTNHILPHSITTIHPLLGWVAQGQGQSIQMSTLDGTIVQSIKRHPSFTALKIPPTFGLNWHPLQPILAHIGPEYVTLYIDQHYPLQQVNPFQGE